MCIGCRAGGTKGNQGQLPVKTAKKILQMTFNIYLPSLIKIFKPSATPGLHTTRYPIIEGAIARSCF